MVIKSEKINFICYIKENIVLSPDWKGGAINVVFLTSLIVNPHKFYYQKLIRPIMVEA